MERTATAWAMPVLFILMWSSGYVAGKVALPFVGPFMLLVVRFGTAAAILLLVALITRAPWPKDRASFFHIAVVGVLIQALQFSGLYSGMALGVSAGVSALIVGTMPLFTALGAAAFLGERVNYRQWLGLVVGLIGAGLVVSHKMGGGDASVAGYVAVLFALAGITLGTLYQKRFCGGMDLRTGGFIQLAVATLLVIPFAYHYEAMAVDWTGEFVAASLWMSLINSVGAISVLYVLIRRGEASRVAGLFYLIPGVTAMMAFLVLGETLTDLAIAGFVIAALGVYMSTKR
jgi:drug/metabolite transporter (DMT)-like permease